MAIETSVKPQHGLDIARVRQDFPILNRSINGHPLIYLDSAATSQKPRPVLDALVGFYETVNANVHRGVHTLSVEATDAYEMARERVARFIGADDPAEIVFTRNTTESLNLLAMTWAGKQLRPGDEILVSRLEHHSNFVPWQQVAQATGAVLRVAPLTSAGQLDRSAFKQMLGPRTRIVALAHASNVLGTILPIQEIADQAHSVGALMIVDGAQSVPHLATDVNALGADFLAFSGHKMLGPMGIGVLWGRRDLLEAMPPFLTGGGMIREVQEDFSTWAPLPEKLEAGTPSVADAVGLAAAIDYLDAVGMENVRAHEVDVTSYALDRLQGLRDIQLYGPPSAADRTGVVAFNLDGVHPHDAGTVLDEAGIAVRAGHHCCQLLHRSLDVAATLRASFYIYNTRDEVDALVEALDVARKLYQRH